MNIVLINSKGGVGKSTISMQIASTYIFQTTGKKVNHFEFDDENQDNISFKKSSIINTYSQKVDKTNLRETLTDILMDYTNVVIDVGANKTTVNILDALLKSGMIFKVDIFIVPIMDGESDANSAIKIYQKIKDMDENATIVFALNRLHTNKDVNSQFDIFLGDDRSIFNEKGIIESIPQKDRHIIKLEDSDVIKYSKNFGLTIWELALTNRDIGIEIKDALNKETNKELIKTLSFKKGIKDDCLNYLKTNLHPTFLEIDKIISNES